MYKNLRLILLVSCFTLVSGLAFTQTGLVAYYPFNGNANDSSGNQYHGTINSIGLTTDRFGRSNSACLFNGTSSYIKLPSAFDYPERTISLWFKANSIGAGDYVLYLTSSPGLVYGHTEIEVRESSRGYFSVGDQLSYVNSIFLNQWYHFALVITTTNFKCYLNGSMVAMNSKTNFTTSNGYNGAILGANRFFTGAFFDGVMDEVKIFNYPLSDQQVANLYNGLASVADEKLNKLNIYPNVTSDKISINNPENVEIKKIFVRNIVGQNMLTINYNSSIDVSALSEGYYLLLLTDKDNNVIKSLRFCKMN